MSVVCPTAAAACLRETVRGRSAMPSFFLPAAIAPDVTMTKEIPAPGAVTWAARARIADSRRPVSGSATIPLPSFTTTRRNRREERIARRSGTATPPRARSDAMRLPPSKLHETVEKPLQAFAGDRGDVMGLPLGVTDGPPRLPGVLPRPREVHLAEGQEGRAGRQFRPEPIQFLAHGPVRLHDPGRLLPRVDDVDEPFRPLDVLQ